MRLKYKKIILLTTLSTMGIGLLTLSVSNDRTLAKADPGTVKEAGLLTSSDKNDKDKSSGTEQSQTPSPTPLPVYKIEKNANPEIQKLFKTFYKAKNNYDIKTIKKLLSNPSEVESKEELQKKTQYIEDYSNIETYVKKGFKEGTYIVYVYHEIKFTGIKTPAPGLSKFYLITDSDNKLKIYSGDMDKTTQAYFDARNEDKDVKAVIDITNEKSQKAIKKDKDLKSFWKNIDKLANSKSN